MNPYAQDALREFTVAPGRTGRYYALSALDAALGSRLARLPVCLRVVLESALRNCDGRRITEAHVKTLAGWRPTAPRTEEVPFVVARVLLQDMTGVPLVVDFAAMREAARRMGHDPAIIEPSCPADLVIDHSVQVDAWGVPDALRRNMEVEFERNRERYEFLKWSAQAFRTFRIVPPGRGICHQVNLEYLSRVVWEQDGMHYPDTLVGIDSHTPMVNGLGVLGWGVGGIEAEAAMLGQPLYFLEPDVIGVHLSGRLRAGVTATDLALTLTHLLRERQVVGKFVEYFGDGAASLPLPDRATIANMAPEYGATCGYFPVDDVACEYLRMTGRGEHVATVRAYLQAQGLYGIPRDDDIDYTAVIELDLDAVRPSVAGPRRPHDRIDLPALKTRFQQLLRAPIAEGGYGKGEAPELRVATSEAGLDVGHGDVVISALTSCTNTSNPGVMLAAGLVAKKAVEKGLKPHPRVKTSLGPGSLAVTEYLRDAKLLPYLELLGYYVSGYGCTTCIGNSGPLPAPLDDALAAHDVVAAAVLSGNRNFEARIHQNVRANFLMSPPLVVAYGLAGTVNVDLATEPLGTGSDGQPVYLQDLWPTQEDMAAVLPCATDAAMFRHAYAGFEQGDAPWEAIPAPTGATYDWNALSTYVRHPPYFEGFGLQPAKVGDVKGARVLALFGDSITTDHISPAGGIRSTSPAGRYLLDHGVPLESFNTYGARRGNHEVMMRGTFANVRIRNRMVPGSEGGVTVHQPSGEQTSIYEAAMRYRRDGVPTVVFGGDEYGQGSSRDWAAKGPQLLGVKAVIVRAFERIHRANLVFMGVLPLQFKPGTSAESLALDGSETIDLTGIDNGLVPRQDVAMTVTRHDGTRDTVPLTLRIDTPIEVDYFRHGGILTYVLRQLLATG